MPSLIASPGSKKTVGKLIYLPSISLAGVATLRAWQNTGKIASSN
jgi:hypothetical protein